MHLVRTCYVYQFCGIIMMGGMVKSVGGWLKSFFFAIGNLCHSRSGNFSKLTWTNPPYTMLFRAKFNLIIGEYNRMIREARLLVLISQPVTLYLSRHATIFVMVLLCILFMNSLDWAIRTLCCLNLLWT